MQTAQSNIWQGTFDTPGVYTVCANFNAGDPLTPQGLPGQLVQFEVDLERMCLWFSLSIQPRVRTGAHRLPLFYSPWRGTVPVLIL